MMNVLIAKRAKILRKNVVSLDLSFAKLAKNEEES